MSAPTPLDLAHDRMTVLEEDFPRRLFYAVLAATELFVPLEGPEEGGRITPLVLEPDTGPLALAFDSEGRLGNFFPDGIHYAALSGRQLAARLGEAGVGLGLNWDAPSEILLPPEVLGWMAETAAKAGPCREADPDADLSPPGEGAAPILALLDALSPVFAGRAHQAILWQDGVGDPALALTGVAQGHRAALAATLAEALAFAGLDPARLSLAFPGETAQPDGALVIDLPAPADSAPSRDPSAPPRL